MNKMMAAKAVQYLYKGQVALGVVWDVCTDIHTDKSVDRIMEDPVSKDEVIRDIIHLLYERHGEVFRKAWKREDIPWKEGLREVLGRYLFLVCGKDPVAREALKELADGVYCRLHPYNQWTSLRHECMEAYMSEKGSLLNHKGLRTALMILEGISGPLDREEIRDELIRIMEVKEYQEEFEPWEQKPVVKEFIDELLSIYSELS